MPKRSSPPTTPTADDILRTADAREAQAERIKAQLRSEKTLRTIRDLKSELSVTRVELEIERDKNAVLESLRTAAPAERPLLPTKRKRDGKLPASFVALASDWHTCEVVSLKQTNGKNEHNVEIGQERAWRWADGVIKMLKREQETCDISTFVLWLGGDFLVNDGMHYKSERATLQSPSQEARIVRELLGGIIHKFRRELDVPRIVIPTSWGNHDRMTEKIIPGHAGDYSHAQEIYRDLKSWFALHDKTIEIRIAEAEWSTTDIHGYPILWHHGHKVAYWGATGGLSTAVMKTVAAQRNEYAFRTFCFGHYHQRGIYQSGLGISNGSLVGPNGYSMDNKFPSERPSQVAFLIDHTRQEISNYYAIWG